MKQELTETHLKLLGVVGLLPVLADFLEDLQEEKQFNRNVKHHVNNLIAQIRKLDNFVIGSADLEAMEQQIDIQRAFRTWIFKTISDE